MKMIGFLYENDRFKKKGVFLAEKIYDFMMLYKGRRVNYLWRGGMEKFFPIFVRLSVGREWK